MKALLVAFLISSAYAQTMQGNYTLDVGEAGCPIEITIQKSNKDNSTRIRKLFANESTERESYQKSTSIQTSRKVSTVLTVSTKKITIETYEKPIIGRAQLITYKSYTAAPRVMRHSLIYQESDRETLEFMRCLYIRL